MGTDTSENSTVGGIVVGTQSVFLLSLSICSLLAAVGFSLFLFGATSGFMASTVDRIYTAGIGLGMIVAGAGGSYLVLR